MQHIEFSQNYFVAYKYLVQVLLRIYLLLYFCEILLFFNLEKHVSYNASLDHIFLVPGFLFLEELFNPSFYPSENNKEHHHLILSFPNTLQVPVQFYFLFLYNDLLFRFQIQISAYHFEQQTFQQCNFLVQESPPF